MSCDVANIPSMSVNAAMHFGLAACSTRSRFCATPHAHCPVDRRHRENDQHDAPASTPYWRFATRNANGIGASPHWTNRRAGREAGRIFDSEELFLLDASLSHEADAKRAAERLAEDEQDASITQ